MEKMPSIPEVPCGKVKSVARSSVVLTASIYISVLLYPILAAKQRGGNSGGSSSGEYGFITQRATQENADYYLNYIQNSR